jgi:acyl-CoA synthetase (AMP-forming)/AMP-acid ligase II
MCPESVVERWSRPGRQMFNTYGPTEATVSASLARLTPGRPITIGTPLPNYGLLVIGTDTARQLALTLLPRGEMGELCITGPGLAAGYLGRPDLTAEKFLANPWSSGPHDARLYRTGDLARIDADGEVQCLGRTDDQVKIRGFRVELGEIEARAGAAAGRRHRRGAAAQGRRHRPAGRLLVPSTGARSTRATLRHALAATCRRTWCRAVTRCCRDAAPDLRQDRPQGAQGDAAAAPPAGAVRRIGPARNAGRSRAVRALAKLFPGQPIRRDADFFTDLGGHSFFAARLASACAPIRASPT